MNRKKTETSLQFLAEETEHKFSELQDIEVLKRDHSDLKTKIRHKLEIINAKQNYVLMLQFNANLILNTL